MSFFGEKTKEQYDKKSMPHDFKIGDKVLIANDPGTRFSFEVLNLILIVTKTN